MKNIDIVSQRFTSLGKEIERLKESDFPDEESRAALESLEEAVKKRIELLGKNIQGSKSEVGIFQFSLHDLVQFTPILGFILRSTNTRNAFEARGPLARLARKLLGKKTKLIISSEWDYSPFLHRSIESLKDFVLIGLPAPESPNPLIIPLAGHELGHAVLRSGFERLLSEALRISDRTKDFIKKEKDHVDFGDLISEKHLLINQCIESQVRETFCDCMGLLLFAESYVYAFHFLIIPGTAIRYISKYPSNKARASNLLNAAEKYGILFSDDFKNEFMAGFMTETELKDPNMTSVVKMAGDLLDLFVDEIVNFVADIEELKLVPKRDSERVDAIYHKFRDTVAPVSSDETLVDILNAAWKCNQGLQDQTIWTNTRIKPEDKFRILADLTFKSMEVSEVYYRSRGNGNDT